MYLRMFVLFAIGLLVEHSVDLSPQYMHVLSALRVLFNVSPTDASAKLNAKDNAAARFHPGQGPVGKVPFAQGPVPRCCI